MNNLHKSVLNFKKWAKKYYPHRTEDNDNGQWELGSREFDEMCSRILKTIDALPRKKAGREQIDDILYGIARDSECCMLVRELLSYPRWYSLLCKKSLDTGYTNAKWQFAESLRDCPEEGTKKLIFKFLEAGDEYTERLALMSLACICPEKAEEYAVKFYERGKFEPDEYQKIWRSMCCTK